MRHNLNHPIGKDEAIKEFKRLLHVKAIIDLKEVKKTRTSSQNAALWLYFKMVASELNEIGFLNSITSIITGETMEVLWNKDSIHDIIWIPLQMAAFNSNSTTKLDRKQIDPIYDTINEWLGSKGIHVPFPDIKTK